ncbi:G-protein coupled receptor 151 [Dissostichus eleginoides]|uniref:G-protein coupled receptor 151 n=1 Tax=Dissostichus eleginoides TaxID=100907 RepID=A0AAD9FI88_DISEL|nr:G-protein coupled receptor 151 [Dissostichus eleginoides]
MDKLSGNNATLVNSSIDKWSFNERGFAHRGKLSLINSLVFNLMFADGLVLLFAVPFRAAVYSKASWTLGWVVCKTADWFLQSCMAAKSFTVAIMAKACYRYVSNPNKQVSIHLGSILVVFFFIWLSACSVTIPHWLFATLQREARGLVCVMVVPPEARDFMAVYIKAYPLGVYCAPLSFALMYFWRAYSQCQRRSSKSQNLRTQIRSRKLTLMLFSLTVAMAILWLPQWVEWLLTFSLSLVNPLIVLSLSEEFREGYRGLWRRLTLRKHRPTKKKPGPHNPTCLQSPRPRPETSFQLRGEKNNRSTSSQGPSREAEPQPEQGGEREVDTESLKDGIVLPDLEQFWHMRETGSNAEENDPVPWENQNKEGEK